jgi:single-strand selective monofunctional uracil DNA glycosylase
VTPEAFFARFFVWNYCPLAFMEASGRNRTPDKLPVRERTRLFEICDGALDGVMAALEPTHVVGIGRFAFDRAVKRDQNGIVVGCAPHPSPASPAANRGWVPQFEAALAALGIGLP